ncbi:hypothetical protein Rsub_07938 [Raphidocelis subcapitata]|uniref:Uncharacterized protein n=1 Tax=Raphidocelis subcapitata TaxID=307507 RepID=A0A2V0PBE9_9CHLO|nr:hypothetical protein Rsub_07938 [Raphidocelis subcapitata]|eukprot:GBF95223.1 hypothetical protein Rsub_07938 [Raphidocelis subcapitata]
MDRGDAPLLEVEQDNGGAPPQLALRMRGAGGNDEDEWQMVTPGGSPRGSMGSAHTSLSSGAVSEHDSECSESGAQAELNSLALADSILASRELPASDAPCHPPTPSPSVHGGDERAFDAAAAPACADEEGEHADADSAAEAAEPAAEAAAAALPAEAADGDYACPALDSVVAAVAACSSGAACALRGAGAELGALSRWLIESVAALAQSARGGGAAVQDALRGAMERLLEALPHTGKGGAGDVDWLAVMLAGGAVSAAAAALFLLHRNSLLRSALHQRDRELAKLVVRIMSLQEVLAGHHRHHPVTRYTTTTTTTHAAFTGFAASMAYL